MKKVCMLFVLVFVISAVAQDKAAANDKAKEEPKFKINASVDIQAKKALWDNHSSNNLEQLFGRINFGGEYNSDAFSAMLNIRAYPEGFGYDALTGVNFDIWFWELQTTTTQMAKFQITEAWAKYCWKYFGIRAGLFTTDLSQTHMFGNYLDRDVGEDFLKRYTIHNAIEFLFPIQFSTTSIMFGIIDKEANHGYLRVVEQLRPMENLLLGLGYRSNIFDQIHYGTEEKVFHRIYAEVSYEIMKGFKPYIEFGALNFRKLEVDTVKLRNEWHYLFENELTTMWWDEWKMDYFANHPEAFGNERYYPVLVGLTIPTGKILDLLALEVEIVDKRKVQGVDKLLEYQLTLIKKLGSRVSFTFGAYSDPDAKYSEQMAFSLRFTSLLH